MGAAKYKMNLHTKNLGKPLCDVECRGIRNKILNAVFGGKKRLLIIAPADCVECISFDSLDGSEDQARECV